MSFNIPARRFAMNYRQEIYRKLIHLSSLWMVLAVYIIPRPQAIYLFTGLTLGMLTFEWARRHVPYIRLLTLKYIGGILRPHEMINQQNKMTGAFYTILSGLICVVFFTPPVAMVALAVMVLSDTSAALIGRKYGMIKIIDKSLEGSLAFFITTLVILASAYKFGMPLTLLHIIVVGFLSTLAELFSNKLNLDDNIFVSLITGIILQYTLMA
jgi:dolichol kinase